MMLIQSIAKDYALKSGCEYMRWNWT